MSRLPRNHGYGYNYGFGYASGPEVAEGYVENGRGSGFISGYYNGAGLHYGYSSGIGSGKGYNNALMPTIVIKF